jgi:hypothetical protein
MATADQNLSTFYADRTRMFREYVAGCIAIADKALRAFQAKLGPDAKVGLQALKPSGEQKQISPNGILQEDGVAVFGYAIDFTAAGMPPHTVNFFLSVGRRPAQKGKVDEWYVGHEEASFSLSAGGDDKELEPFSAHVVRALENAIVQAYPIGAGQTTSAAKEAPQAAAKDAKNDAAKDGKNDAAKDAPNGANDAPKGTADAPQAKPSP